MKEIKAFISKRLEERKINKLRDMVVNVNSTVIPIGEKVKDFRKYGFSMSDSQAFRLSEDNYKDYISTWESYQPRLANAKYSLISDDKFLFSLVMGKVANVPEIYGTIEKGVVNSFNKSGITNDNIYDFLLKNNGGVIKDRGGKDGFAVYVLKNNNGELNYKSKDISRGELLDIISKISNGIVTKRLIQGSFENEIYPESVNTVRIISMAKKGERGHEIVAALQRIGTAKSYPCDNFNQGGGSALIDIETGVIGKMTCADSIDEAGERIFYSKHPDTNSQIEGKVIPNWEMIKNGIVEITKELPLWKYVAWDVVVMDDSFAIIETNMKSSLNVFQVHGGMRNTHLGEKYRENGYLID